LSKLIVYTKKQETANRLTHALGILFFVPAGFYLIHHGYQYIAETNFQYPVLLLAALTMMSIFVLMIYTSSTIYHSANQLNRLHWRKFDHISIFWGIAGTYLPFIVMNYAVTGKKLWLFFFMIALAILGTLFKLLFLHVNKIFYTSLYLLMGWVIVFFGKAFVTMLPQSTIILLIIGGAAYTIGVIFYLSKKLYYSHAIWHLFVLLGSVSHYFAVISLLTI